MWEEKYLIPFLTRSISESQKGTASMHILSLFCRECSLFNLASVTDPDHFGQLDQDPHQIEKPHQSKQQDSDPHQN
jgi:hypothetical protein